MAENTNISFFQLHAGETYKADNSRIPVLSEERLPMVTIVITTCKRKPEIIERAITSVIQQTYADWELIVVDDSPDEYEFRSAVRQCVLKFAEKNHVTYLPNDNNSGACYSRNKGLDRAKGEYIAYLDDDDEWLPDKLEKQVNAFQKASEKVALIYSPFILYDEMTGEKKECGVPEYRGSLYEKLMQYGNFIGGMSVPLMRTEAVKEIGGFDELMQSAQDLDLWMRLSEKFEFDFTEKPTVLYHVHDGEQISGNPLKKIAGIERLCEKNKEYILQHKSVNAREKRSLSWFYARAGKKKEAYRLWLDAVKLCPGEIWKNTEQFLLITLRT